MCYATHTLNKSGIEILKDSIESNPLASPQLFQITKQGYMSLQVYLFVKQVSNSPIYRVVFLVGKQNILF